MGQRRIELTPERSARHRLGAELRARRDQAGLSLAQLGARILYNAGFLGRIERGERFPSLDVIDACDVELGASGELSRLWHEAEAERDAGTAGDSSAVAPSAVVPAQRAEPVAVTESAVYPGSVVRAVSLVDGLAGADLADSPAVMRARWQSDVIPGVITGFMFSGSSWHGGLEADGVPPVLAGPTAAAPQRIRETTRTLLDLDFRQGGGSVRRLLLSFTRAEVLPLLRRSHPDAVRRELFGAAAETVQLLGWAAYDAGRHGAAERFLIQALRLAAEAEDPVFGARLLANLSHQANYLGHYDQALQLARAAQSAAGTRATPAVRAMFLAMEARALASLGDARGCARVLHRAEAEFERSTPGTDPEWISYFDSLELAGEAAHCARDLGNPREVTEFAARAIDPVLTPPRTRAFIQMVTAAGALRAGNLDEALALASSAVELASGLQSARYLRYVADFHASAFGQHAGNLTLRQFTNLLTRSYPALQLGAGS